MPKGKTAYSRAMEHNRKEERERKKKIPRTQAVARGKCGAKRSSKNPENKGLYCRNTAGWGTTHPGIGKCKYHGGNLPTHQAHAAKEAAIKFMGAPKEISPIDAIMWCIHITAGEVEWLTMQIAEITDEDEWYEHTVIGKQMHILQRTRAEAQDRLVKYSKDAIALGLAERAVRLAEQYGQTIARLLDGIRHELKLNGEQQKKWPIIVRKQLILLEGGNVRDNDSLVNPIVAIPKRTGVAQ